MEQTWVEKIDLYSRIYVPDLVDNNFKLYGFNFNCNNFWYQIDYCNIDDYDMVIERSIICSKTFVVIKLLDKKRKYIDEIELRRYI